MRFDHHQPLNSTTAKDQKSINEERHEVLLSKAHLTNPTYSLIAIMTLTNITN